MRPSEIAITVDLDHDQTVRSESCPVHGHNSSSSADGVTYYGVPPANAFTVALEESEERSSNHDHGGPETHDSTADEDPEDTEVIDVYTEEYMSELKNVKESYKTGHTAIEKVLDELDRLEDEIEQYTLGNVQIDANG